MKNLHLKKYAGGLAAALIVGACLVPSSSQAVSVTLAQALGFVTPGTSTADADNLAYINSLVARANGISSLPFDLSGNTYTLVNNPVPILPFANTPVTSGGVGGDNTINATGSIYLIVKYDGANGEAYVWDVTGLGSVTVPGNDGDTTHNANKFVLTGASGTPPQSLPDGGSSLLLMALGLAGLALARFCGRRSIA